jgi:hypothetical protein
MEKLFEDRKIENAPNGRKGDERRKIVIVGSAEIADLRMRNAQISECGGSG